MKRSTVVLALIALFFFITILPSPAAADSSHARIVRLSLIQGDVRFAREFHDDPLTDTKAVWETAPLNLPIREGYAVATGNGRAEVEFENGAMAFLGANSVVEFYDLSLHDGGRISRLVLRQGSGIFYVNPAMGDYFSVTGGDFTVEANGRTTFRVDNFDDGSTVNVERGRVAVLHRDDSTPLGKGQSLSVHVNDGGKQEIGRAADLDDFDHWVSGRIDSVVTATNNSAQYVNSPNYTAGFSDLYTYGSWYSVAGYGYGWRPFGVGLGWCPFDYGNFYFDQGLGGWGFMGSAPWGWLPYHYGGWTFAPAYGWVWLPTGFGPGTPLRYQPVTAVWVRSGTTLGLVPASPADAHGKTAANLAQGIYPVQGNTVGKSLVAASGTEKWSVVKQVPRDTLAGASLTRSAAPTGVSRTIATTTVSTVRPVTATRQSSIVYDPTEHRFVNSNTAPNGVATASAVNSMRQVNEAGHPGVTPANAVNGNPSARNTTVTSVSRGVVTPTRPALTPAPARTGGSSGSSSGAWNSSVWGMPGSSAGTNTSRGSSSSSHPSSGGGRVH
jgi:hypothetical protein